MKNVVALPQVDDPHLVRLQRLAPLGRAEVSALLVATKQSSVIAARREIIHIGATLNRPMVLVRGWAAHVRDFRDGRRQIMHLLLPGDMISVIQRPGLRATTTIVALTNVSVAPTLIAEHHDSGLGLAYARSAELERLSLLRQIARLGRLDAYERLADLFLELVDRFRLFGLAASDSFELPVTQEILGDCLGLTSIHVNRTLQQMRRDGMIDDRSPVVRLLDADRLRYIVDYRSLEMDGWGG